MAPPEAQHTTLDMRAAERERGRASDASTLEKSPDFPIVIIGEHLRQMSGEDLRVPNSLRFESRFSTV